METAKRLVATRYNDIDPYEDTERHLWCKHRREEFNSYNDIDPYEDTERSQNHAIGVADPALQRHRSVRGY